MTVAAPIVADSVGVYRRRLGDQPKRPGKCYHDSEVDAGTGAGPMRHKFARRSHKYNARAVVIDGIRFDSVKEGR